MASDRNRCKIALIQLTVVDDKLDNAKRAISKIDEAATHGANVVVLPEFFNAPVGEVGAKSNCENIPGPCSEMLAEAARRNKIHLIAGSMPELEDGKIFNTCPVFNPAGQLIAKFRKIHLFDIDIPGKMTCRESDVMTPGSQPVILDLDPFKIGIGICHDVRFNELSRFYTQFGCNVLVFPSAFTVPTGELYWELLARSQAANNQAYCCLCSPSRQSKGCYPIYGHSMVSDPWGTLVSSAETEETIVYADLDITRVMEVRQAIPVASQRREDIYNTIAVTKPVIAKGS